jgi:glycosyltransferase involved in cell wall biosynthesis
MSHAAELGGAELSLIRSLRTLPTDHRPVRLLWLSEGPAVEQLRTLGLPVDVIPLDEGVLDTHRFAATGRGLGRRVAGTTRTAVAVARWLRRHDVGLVMTTSMKALVVGTVAAGLARRPVVWWVHDRISPDYLPGPLVRALRAGARRIPRAIVVNSEATAATLPAARHVHIAYPGFAPEQARPTPRPRPAGPPVVGLVGRISPTKGQLEFVRAAAILRATHPDARFRIIGAPMFGAEDYAEHVAREARRLGISDAVELTGFIPDTRPELDAMSVCVHASPVPEPFGNVVVESMVRGVPVIATNAGGVPEILAPDGVEPLGLLVPPGDVAALARAITAALDDPDTAEARAARAHASATVRFPAACTMAVLTTVWDEVIGAWRPSVPPRREWPAGSAYRPPADVAWVTGQPGEDDVAPVHVARLPEGPINLLAGSAAVIWRAATSAAPGAWLDVVAAELGGSVDELRPQVEEFVDSLVASGLLEGNDPQSG